MGSGKHCKTKTQITMADEKKSLLNTCKNAFKWFKGKGKESKEVKNEKNTKKEEKVIMQPPKVTPVAELLEKLEKEKRKEQQSNEEEDEMANFTHTTIEEDTRALSVDSQSSIDSGYTEKEAVEDKESADLANKLKTLKIESQSSVESGFSETATEPEEGKDERQGDEDTETKDKKKKKKWRTVVIPRAPIRPRNDSHINSHPYVGHTQDGFRQTQIQSQINKQALCGGHVIVNETKTENLYLAEAFNKVDQSVQDFTKSTKDEQENFYLDALAYLKNDSTNPLPNWNEEFGCIPTLSPPIPQQSPSFYDVFNSPNDTLSLPQPSLIYQESQIWEQTGFPTPPRSDNAPSPTSDFLNLTNSEYSPGSYSTSPYMSPRTSSPLRHFHMEQFKPVDEPNLSSNEPLPVTNEETPKADRREKRTSNTLKHYKDLQKAIGNEFSKKDCCQFKRPPCKEILQQHMDKLKKEDKLNICLKVAKMDSKNDYGVLCEIIMMLSKSETTEDMPLAIFSLICEKLLAQKPELFIETFGLNLIKLAALRCYSRPFVTRYLVHCVRLALKATGGIPGENTHVFQELDALGDNLLHACVREGDKCADVLSELVRKEAEEMPLFKIHQQNMDGSHPLHLACSLHSAQSPRGHAAHVLLAHAGADLWRWEEKGGETSLHLAVNSATCDLSLVMILFRHVERKDWKRLAHYRNRSQITSLDYARTNSRSRTNYPMEVLEFLQKCR